MVQEKDQLSKDIQYVVEHGLESMGRVHLERKTGWTARRIRAVRQALADQAAAPVQATIEEKPSTARTSKVKADKTPEAIRAKAASAELTVPFSNWLGKGWHRVADEPQEVWATNDQGDQELVGLRADAGVMWPDNYSGPRTYSELFIEAQPPRPISWGVFVSSIQSQTPIHGPAYMNAAALCAHYGIGMSFGGFVYGKGLFEGSQKSALEIAPWSSLVESYVGRERISLGSDSDGINLAHEMNASPTAANPLSGMETYCKGRTTIFPSPRQDMQTLPRMKNEAQAFMWCSGAMTVPNYVLRKAGLKALMDHVIGGILVLCDLDGKIFTRNIHCHPDTGEIWDLDVHVGDGVVRDAAVVREERGLEGPILALGCTHKRWLNPACGRAVWGFGGQPAGDVSAIDALRPSRQVVNDILDSNAISHHDRENPWISYEKSLSGRDDMAAEIEDVARFVGEIERPGCETIVVYSNHDDHYGQWLRSTDWRDDMTNAELYLESNLAQVRAIKAGSKMSIFEWALRKFNPSARFRLATADDPLRFFKFFYNLHGDKGVNGARGSTVGLRRLGLPIAKAHDHLGTALGWMRSVFNLIDYPTYANGPSSWAKGMGLEHPDGAFQMVPFVGEKWRP